MSNWTAPTTFALNAAVTSTTLNQYIRDNLQALSPIGSYIFVHSTPSASLNTVNGAWLECNGVAVSRSTYSALFGVISTTYGAGDGSTTFNIPDFRGRMPISAASGGHADVNALGGNDGTTLTARRPRHSHTAGETAHTHTPNAGTSGGFSDGHQHTTDYPALNFVNDVTPTLTRTDYTGSTTHTTSSAGGHSHSMTASFSGPSAHATVGVTTAPVDCSAYLLGMIICIKAFT